VRRSVFFVSSRRRHTRCLSDWSSDVCSSDLCLMQETGGTYDGRAVTRIDVGLDGTVDGYLAKVGNYKEYFSNSPDLVFPQTWGRSEERRVGKECRWRWAPELEEENAWRTDGV